jgi:hypothetical protein
MLALFPTDADRVPGGDAGDQSRQRRRGSQCPC